MMLPDAYLRAVSDAVHAVGGMFVLDCIASGTIWVDMQATGVDILIGAPQKGWSASPCCALVMLGALARERIEATTSTSFACDLRKWLQIMETYERGGHAYHATMPTDGLATLRDVIRETEAYGFDKVRDEQLELGQRIRSLLASKGFKSVAKCPIPSAVCTPPFLATTPPIVVTAVSAAQTPFLRPLRCSDVPTRPLARHS